MLRANKRELIRLLNRQQAAGEPDGQTFDWLGTEAQPAVCHLPDDLLEELANWPDPPTEAELRARGRGILRNITLARERRELADAGDAWDRMHGIFRSSSHSP